MEVGNRQDVDRTDRCTGSGIRKLVAQASKIGLGGAERAPHTSAVSPIYTHGLPALVFLQSQILMAGVQEALRMGWGGTRLHSLQAEEDKEEQTDNQPDASSSQTVTPMAEPPSTEPTPSDGPTSLGPLDLLPSEELLTDTSNSSSSTGEEGEAAALVVSDKPYSDWLKQGNCWLSGLTNSRAGWVRHSHSVVRHLYVFSSALKVAGQGE